MTKILIVEDEKSLQIALAEKLRSVGYNVTTCSDGEEAIGLAADIEPEIILLDVLLPHLSGIEVLKEIRNDESLKDTKVMILTNLDDITTVGDTVELGISNYIVKADSSLDEIVNQLNEVVKQSEKET